MPKTIAKLIGVTQEDFDRLGVLNASIDIDTKLFIDPKLLKHTQEEHFSKSYEKVQAVFLNVIKLVKLSRSEGDRAWREAKRELTRGEAPWLCIGYSKGGVRGSGIGPDQADSILEAIKEILSLGIDDPEIFELIGVFEEGIGPDKISDLVANIIVGDIISYSEYIYSQLASDKTSFRNYKHASRNMRLPENQGQKNPVLLLLKSILRALPIALDWSDIDTVSAHNASLRKQVNDDIGNTWKNATQRIKKDTLARTLKEHPELYKDLLDQYKAKEAQEYNYESDPAGQVTWIKAAESYTAQHPLQLALSSRANVDEVLFVITTICNKFKDLVENNGLNKLMYKDELLKQPKKEEASQLLFYGIADSYCESNNVDLSREANAGRGPVDFKMSAGYKSRVLVEVKLNSNGKLEHGFNIQLEQYKRSEKTDKAIFLIIMVGNNDRKVQRLVDKAESQRNAGHPTPDIIIVDARPKPSASHI